MALLQKTLLFFALWNGVEALEANDFTFGQFCNRPPNFGKGELLIECHTQEGEGSGSDLCKVTYNVRLDDDIAAANFCEQQHAYSLKSFERKKEEKQTICTIGNYFKCKGSEVLIDSTCYIVKNEKGGSDIIEALRSACGSRHTIHEFKSHFEQKWVATYFTNFPMLWIANTPNDPITKNLRFAPKDEVLVSKTGRMEKKTSKVMAVVTSVRTRTKIPRGSVVMASQDLSLPVLCSRPAEQLPGYAQALMEKMNELGITSYIKKDAHDKDRLFFVLREYSSFDMSDGSNDKMARFMVGTKRLHKGCSAFLNGYAASPLDFKNIEDFKKILEAEKVNIVSVPGRRWRYAKDSSSSSCYPATADGAGDFKFDLPDGSEKETSANAYYWAARHPNQACSDTPRIALGFSEQGCIDIPAIARHFTLCTYGPPPPPSDPSLNCHFAATYKDGKCVCNVQGTDYMEQQRFDRTRTYEQGKLCVECEMEPSHSVFIVVDVTSKELSNAFLKIVPHVMFPFIVTKSWITTQFYGNQVWFQYIRYGPGKHEKNYDHWRWMKGYVESNYVGTEKNFEQGLHYAHYYYGNTPPHRRVLIIMTNERNENTVRNALERMQRDQKIGKIFAFATYTPTVKWPTVDEKVYYVDPEKADITIDIWKAVTDISQHAAMNVCLRERQ